MSIQKLNLALASALAALVLGGGAAAAEASSHAEATLHADQPGPVIEPAVYGQFAEHLGRGIYEGIWVGPDSKIPNTRGYRNDVLDALKRIHVPVVRWPGGCFADEYHWRDGIGPRDKRPVRVNRFWGGVEEPNAFGSDEYFQFSELIGAKTYITADLGTGTPQEMAQWIEYLTTPTHSTLGEERRRNGRDKPYTLNYVALGNESWGCGGNMRPEHYVDVARQFSSFIPDVPGQPHFTKIAVGPSSDDYAWTEAVMSHAAGNVDAISLHYYTIPTGSWDHKGAATGFPEDEWIKTFAQTLRMEDMLSKHIAIMDKYDPKKRVGLYVDEWGTWYDVEKGTNPGFLFQDNTLRDALVAAVNLNIFHHHADRVRMTNIAQMVNVLQAMILTDKEKMLLTPTYHVYDMYQVFQGATELPIELQTPTYAFGGVSLPSVSVSAGKGTDGVTHLGLVNLDPRKAVTVEVKLAGLKARSVAGRVLTATAMDARNRFDAPETVKPAPYAGGSVRGEVATLTLPPKSVVVVDLK